MIKDMQVNEVEEGIMDVVTIIDKDTVKSTFEKSINKVQQKATLKGFRKGKAPLHLVQNVYDSEIRYETINALFPSIYDMMIKEHNINPIATPEISGYDNFTLGEDLTLKCKVEISPYVKELSPIDNVKVEKVEYTYNEAELVEKELESLCQLHATYHDLEGPIKLGDFVQVRYSIDSEDFKRGDTTHYVMVKQNDPQFEFTSKLIDKALGGTYTETVTFSAFYNDQELADKTVNITFTPLEGRTVIAPEMDDELAKKFGFDDVSALKEEIKKVLKTRSQMKGLFDTSDLIATQLAENSTFSISEKVVMSQTQHQLQKKLQDIMKDGSFEQYSKGKGFSDEDFIAEVRADAKKSVEKFLIHQELIKNFKIEASDEELENFLHQVAQQEIPNRKEIVDFYKQNPSKKEDLKNQLLIQKLSEELLNKVNFIGTQNKTMEHQNLGA